jgi:hypothetical protein
MGRGIETSKLFRTRKDREDFIDRLAEFCRLGRVCLGVDAQPFSPAGSNRKRAFEKKGSEPGLGGLGPGDRRRPGDHRIGILYDDKIYGADHFKYEGKKAPARLLQKLITAGIPTNVRPAVIMGTQEDSKEVFIVPLTSKLSSLLSIEDFFQTTNLQGLAGCVIVVDPQKIRIRKPSSGLDSN